MKKILVIILFLTSCSFQNSGNYWDNNLNNEILDFEREYTFNEYKTILEKYNDRKGFPEIN